MDDFSRHFKTAPLQAHSAARIWAAHTLFHLFLDGHL
jgi:hypothetical protein